MLASGRQPGRTAMVRSCAYMFLGTVLLMSTATMRAQSLNASISGVVKDPTGAAVPSAGLTLRALSTGYTVRTASGSDGLFAFPNLQSGAYELSVSAKGFRDYLQKGIVVNIDQSVRVDVELALGTALETVEVMANASPLNFETAEIKQAITPENIQSLPLLLSGNIRSAAQFVILMPGVTTGAGNNGFDARINGGLQSSDEAVLDGVTMQDAMNSQSGMTEAFTDHPISPETVGEISVLSSNYEPQYGDRKSTRLNSSHLVISYAVFCLKKKKKKKSYLLAVDS